MKNIEIGAWKNPLPNCQWSLPLGKYHESGFGAKRKYNLHTGIDLFCEHNQPVASVEDGIIVSIEDFSKKKKNTPWLNKTRVILIEGRTGVVAYCNVLEIDNIRAGDKVKAGQIIGRVIKINKNKNSRENCMLHFELYEKNTIRRVSWSYNFPKPPQLLDPSEYLLKIITNTQVCYRRTTNPKQTNET